MPKRDGTDLARALATKAEADEAVVEKLAADADVPDEVIGFHAQQAVEKRIKSVLASGASLDRQRIRELVRAVVAGRGPNEREAALTAWLSVARLPAPG